MIFQPARYPVAFWNGSVQLRGDLVIPPGPGPHPVLVLVGANGGPRDRGRWVHMIAQGGLGTLSWDSPGWGGSTGQRCWQAPDERTMEVLAAVDFLRDVRGVCTAVGVIGADLGCWAAVLAAGLSSRVEALVLLSPSGAAGIGHQVLRLGQRLRGAGFIQAEIGLAQLVLTERIRRLAQGADGATVLASEAPCRHAPWYQWLPGTTPAEIEAFGGLAAYDLPTLLASVRCPVLGLLGADDPSTLAWHAEALQLHLRSSLSGDHQVAVLPRTDDALRPVWVADSAGPGQPGDWHPELVGFVTQWLVPRIGRPQQLPTALQQP
jgi:pimeloyl-ACP methyl ester carboxylesterase